MQQRRTGVGMRMEDKARRRGNEGKGERQRDRERERELERREGREKEREERVSIGVVRGRTCLYYTKGTDGGTRRPRGLPLMMLYSRLPRSLVPTRRFARLARHSRAQDACIVRGWPTLPSAPSRRTSALATRGSSRGRNR